MQVLYLLKLYIARTNAINTLTGTCTIRSTTGIFSSSSHHLSLLTNGYPTYVIISARVTSSKNTYACYTSTTYILSISTPLCKCCDCGVNTYSFKTLYSNIIQFDLFVCHSRHSTILLSSKQTTIMK